MRYLEMPERAQIELAWDSCLSLAAEDHLRDTGPAGLMGHVGTRGSTLDERVNRHASGWRRLGENIDYGNDEAAAIVRALIIDDGVRSRGHRTNIFKPEFNAAGAYCGPFRSPEITLQKACVIDYAQF